jgi:hypothetical protein
MKYFIAFFSLLVTTSSFCQNFEGLLKYKLNLEIDPAIEKSGVTKQMIIDNMKTEGTYAEEEDVYYKDGNYYLSLAGSKKYWSIYNPDNNKIYAFQEGSDEC